MCVCIYVMHTEKKKKKKIRFNQVPIIFKGSKKQE